MKKIWKVWTVILVVAATVLLTISTQYSKKEEISTDSYQYLIGVSLPNVIEPWLNNFVDVFTEKVSQDKKINVIFRDAAGNPEKQIQDIETLMEYGIDILIVSPDGSDSNSGTESEPFKTIEKARDEVRKHTKDMTSDIVVYLKDGVYYQDETLAFGTEDSGTNGYQVRYEAYEGAAPEISGGKLLEGTWEVDDAEKNIYKISVLSCD